VDGVVGVAGVVGVVGASGSAHPATSGNIADTSITTMIRADIANLFWGISDLHKNFCLHSELYCVIRYKHHLPSSLSACITPSRQVLGEGWHYSKIPQEASASRGKWWESLVQAEL
jgi:hypothetical protein